MAVDVARRMREKAIVSKSDMLDQVNELMDTMTVEKQALKEKIASLEQQLREEVNSRATPNAPESAPESPLQKKARAKIKAADIAALKSEVERERKGLRSLQEAVNSLTQFITKDKHALTSKLHSSESKAQEYQLALRAQCQENAKLRSELGHLQTETLTLRAKNKELCCSLEVARQRNRKTRTALLALRGRAANERKQQEREEVSSASLQSTQTEKGFLSVGEPVTHHDNGGRVKQLHAELRRKGELISSYSRRLTDQHTHCSNVEQLVSGLKEQLEEQKKKCTTIQNTLDEKTQECFLVHSKLTETEARLHQLERRYSKVTGGLENKLVQFETQFQQSRRELEDLTAQLNKTQEALELSQCHLTTEQTQTKKLVEASRTVVEGFTAQLDQCRKDHRAEVAQLKRLLVAERQHAQRDIERMKEVSTQRCTELAHEVWVLRTQLDSQRNAQQ